MEQTVLVVGAGPCGLATACALARLGVSVRVVEAAAEPVTGARAILLWPPTLEILRRVGVLDEAEAMGFRGRALNYHLTGGRTVRVGLTSANQPLMLQQDRTNGLLEAALQKQGVLVERSRRVTGVDQSGAKVRVDVTGPGGDEVIEADWLIGADGVGSAVRRALDIEFTGDQFPGTFLLVEGQMTGDFARDELHYLFGDRGALVFAPLPGEVVRVSAPVPPDLPLEPEQVQRILDERGPGGLRMLEMGEITTFTSQERIADAMRRGRCFLVGDAAHTHTPLGGQGLNLGLQDVDNLVWKLAGVIKGRFGPEILDTYDPERRHVAQQTVQLTRRLTRIAMVGPTAAKIRNVVWGTLQNVGALRRWYAPTLAGWRTRYPETLPGAFMTNGAAPRRARLRRTVAPAAGSRTASLTVGSAADPARFSLVTLGGSEELRTAGRELATRLPLVVAYRHMPQAGGRSGFVLLRPDGYAAASGRTPADLTGATRFLEKTAAR